MFTENKYYYFLITFELNKLNVLLNIKTYCHHRKIILLQLFGNSNLLATELLFQ